MLTTTLNEIRDASPCKDGWEKLLKHIGKTGSDDEALPVATILEANGIEDTLWVLTRACGERGRAICAAFAADCAERVLPIWEAHYPDDGRPRATIDAARSGDAAYAVHAVHAAAYAVRDFAAAYAADAAFAAHVAARDAAYAAYAVHAAACAVRDFAAAYAADAAFAAHVAADDDERAWQTTRLRELIEGAV